jgi:hypothetical protein
MAIVTDRELADALTTEATVVFQVWSPAAPVADLLAALRATSTDIWALSDGGMYSGTGPKFVSSAIPTPSGPVLMVDFGATPENEVRSVPALIARHLRDAGVVDAEIRLPEPGPGVLLASSGFTPMTRALLRGPLGPPHGTRPAGLTGDLLDLAIDWLRAEHRPGAELVGLAASVEFPLSFDNARDVLGKVLDADPNVNLATGDLGRFVAAAALAVWGVTELALTAGAAEPDTGLLAGLLRRQRDVIRRAAPAVVWAGVTAEKDFSLYSTYWVDPAPFRVGHRRRSAVQLQPDTLVPDAMWCQILSPGHLDRLGGSPPGAVEVAQDRFELTVGEPEQWLPGHPDRPAVQARGRQLLAGCIVTPEEADAMTRQRRSPGG